MHRITLLSIVVLRVLTAAGMAQQPAPLPAFEVASIRPSADSLGPNESDVQPSGRFVVTNASLPELLRVAYELQRHELVFDDRLPAWVASQRWDIVGKGPPLTDEEAQRPLFRRMMLNLLIERFQLVTRQELRDIPVYALVLARDDGRPGPQMRPSSADCPALLAAFKATGARLMYNSPVCGVRPLLRGQFSGIGMLLPDFARTITPMAGRPVVDATGLTGAFDLDMKFTPGDASDPATGASLFTAIQEQLGLRLEPRRAPVNVLVVESAQRPTPD